MIRSVVIVVVSNVLVGVGWWGGRRSSIRLITHRRGKIERVERIFDKVVVKRRCQLTKELNPGDSIPKISENVASWVWGRDQPHRA